MRINNYALTRDTFDTITSMTCQTDGRPCEHKDAVVKEHFIDLFINEQFALKLVCTPVNLTELVIGRMLTEQYINSLEDIQYIYICESGAQAKVYLKKDIQAEHFVKRELTCCTQNCFYLNAPFRRNLEPLRASEWKTEWIFALAQEFAKGSEIHDKTYGTHSCYLGVQGRIVFRCEDLGRHNAMDKAIGYARINKYKDCMIYTTGRIVTEMVEKVVAARIPVLVSKAVPTNEAVRMAEYYNLTLICKAWPDQFELYNQAK